MPSNRTVIAIVRITIAVATASAILIPAVVQASSSNHDVQVVAFHCIAGAMHDHAFGPIKSSNAN